MEKGQMRVELNISVSTDPNKFGTKVEVKNINSFKAVEKAAEYETKRMIALIEDGKINENWPKGFFDEYENLLDELLW
jgi:aspartyl-tRNA(Asn)/glutamyl-tRNA(Gln) amidotransferase subunit B